MNVAAQNTVANLRAHRVIGLARAPRRRLPRQIIPSAIEREYAKAILAIVSRVQGVMSPLLAEMPALLASAAREREDAGEGGKIRALLEVVKRRMSDTISLGELEALATRFVQRVSQHNRVQLGRQAKAALGVDVFVSDRRLGALTEGFVAENVALITSIPEKLLGEVATATTRAVASGTLHGDLAKEIAERTGIAMNRAKLIARDQVGKLYGQINHARQKELGVTHFFWRTVNDRRVRPEHAAREGDRFAYDNPPADGLPGEPILCRCNAEPDFSTILEAV